MIWGLGQDEEPPEENGNGDGEEPANGDGVVTIQPYPYPVREPWPYPVYYAAPQQDGLQIGESTIPTWALVLGLGLLAGYVVGGRA